MTVGEDRKELYAACVTVVVADPEILTDKSFGCFSFGPEDVDPLCLDFFLLLLNFNILTCSMSLVKPLRDEVTSWPGEAA